MSLDVIALLAPLSELLVFLIARVAQQNATPWNACASLWVDPFVLFDIDPLVVLRLSAALAQVEEMRKCHSVCHVNPPIS